MRYIIMAAGQGKRWNNYKGVPKHLIEINGETLLGRTTRLLKENGINDSVITISSVKDERYEKYGTTRKQQLNDCEIDRFDPDNSPEICYLYGDVYYSEEAIKTIINTPAKDVLFFGSQVEIFAVKIKDKNLFYDHKKHVKELFLKGKIGRSIGWEVYRSINKIPFNTHQITRRYVVIEDETDDIDYPEDYENFIKRRVK